MGSDDGEENSLFYNLLVFLITGLIFALSIVNAIVYGKIADGDITYGTVSPGGARALQWINAVSAVITGCFAIYYLTISLFKRSYRKEKYEAIKQASYNAWNRARNVPTGIYGGNRQMSPVATVSPRSVVSGSY